MLVNREPVAVLDTRFSVPDAVPTDWATAVWQLTEAEVFWLSTVRPDGRPHVTPLLSVWLDGALYFCTGPTEQKAKNLATNAHCVLTTGNNALNGGLDLVVEGDAMLVRDEATLTRLASAYESKYGQDWHFDVHDGAFHGDGGEAWVYRMTPMTVFGFGKGQYSQTRWRFER